MKLAGSGISGWKLEQSELSCKTIPIFQLSGHEPLLLLLLFQSLKGEIPVETSSSHWLSPPEGICFRSNDSEWERP